MGFEREADKISNQSRTNLAAPTSDKDTKAGAKLKRTSAILEDESEKKVVYAFLEDDYGFEEFGIENDGGNDDHRMIDALFKIQNSFKIYGISQYWLKRNASKQKRKKQV